MGRLRRDRSDGGQAAIELVSYTFLVLLVTVLLAQGLLVAQALMIVQDAARAGAREWARTGSGESGWVAAQRTVPEGVKLEHIWLTASDGAVTVDVAVRVPVRTQGVTLAEIPVRRDATFRLEDESWR